ncbi:MAG: hypothetical protein BroJett038_29100 [Chloroflexota bacterium]|nr:MAG: hypothetical protein BroJett038_29100 [Chloroflexota bacterium]
MVVRQKLYTVEEFEQFIAQAENADRLFELVEGEIVEKVPTEQHGVIVVNISTELKLYIRQTGKGRVAVEVRHQLPGDEHNSRLPDIAYYADSSRPVVEQGAVAQMPDLCVEVQSPDDTPKAMRDKAAYYLANGARLVWLVYPKKRLVEALYPDGEFDIFSNGATVSGGELLPGFGLAVHAVFEE